MNKIRPSLRFLCPSEHIPSNIAVDVSNLDIEDRIFMRDIEVHPSLKLLSKNENMPVCKIVPTSLGNKEPIEAGSLKQHARFEKRTFIWEKCRGRHAISK